MLGFTPCFAVRVRSNRLVPQRSRAGLGTLWRCCTRQVNRPALELYCATWTSGCDRDQKRLSVLLEEYGLHARDAWLLLAARVGDADTVAWLLEAEDANPNVADTEGSTPLMRAVSRGHVDVARVLLQRKDINVSCKIVRVYAPSLAPFSIVCAGVLVPDWMPVRCTKQSGDLTPTGT